MSPRAAKIVSRSLLVIAVVIVATTVIIGLTTFDRQHPGRIVVVPAERAEQIRRAAATLDHERDCAGDVTWDPSLGDAPFAYCQLEIHPSTFEAGWGDLLLFLFGTAWLLTGTLIVSRQQRNTAGWIFTAIGMGFFVEVLAVMLVVKGVKVDPGSIPLSGVWAVAGEYAFLAIGLLPLLFLLYPDGRPPSRRWRWAQWALFLGVGIAVASFALTPGPLNNVVDRGIVYLNPIGAPAFEGMAGAITALGTVIALAASLSTVFAVRSRFKRSSGEERQQMRWLVFVATAAGIAFVILAVGGSVVEGFISNAEEIRIFGIDPFDLVWVIFALTLVIGIPAAYLIAIFKHGLWDLDIVIRKALVAIVLTVLLVGFGVLVIAVLGQTAFWTGTSRSLAILIGVIAGALLWPLIRLSRLIARRIVFGRRADPYAVLTEFSGRVGETYATEDVLPRMAKILAEGTGAERAGVWLNVGGALRPEASSPSEQPAHGEVPATDEGLRSIQGETAFDVRDRGELLGALSVAMPASDPMNPSKERLIRDLASQAGLVLRNVKLIEDLRASRQRLVAAQDEERRKIERNIHDGAQQQLVALSVKQRLAAAMIGRDDERLRAMLDDLAAQTNAALEDLRDLARGIYPPLLADQGLAAALGAQSRKAAIPVYVEADGIGRYPQEVEATVYFCTLEALSNVAKYARASSVRVELEHVNGRLRFSVTDDGIGFDPSNSARGTGLQGMADRLDAIGGQLTVTSAPGRGTEVSGSVRISGGVEA